jgi:hypothetical protein
VQKGVEKQKSVTTEARTAGSNELTADQNVTSADKVSVYIDLRNRWPFPVQNVSTKSHCTKVSKDNERELLNPAPQFRVSKHVISLHFIGGNSLQVKNLDHGSREPTLRFSRSTFHKKHDWSRLGSFLNSYASLLGEVPIRVKATCDELGWTCAMKQRQLEISGKVLIFSTFIMYTN